MKLRSKRFIFKTNIHYIICFRWLLNSYSALLKSYSPTWKRSLAECATRSLSVRPMSSNTVNSSTAILSLLPYHLNSRSVERLWNFDERYIVLSLCLNLKLRLWNHVGEYLVLFAITVDWYYNFTVWCILLDIVIIGQIFAVNRVYFSLTQFLRWTPKLRTKKFGVKKLETLRCCVMQNILLRKLPLWVN